MGSTIRLRAKNPAASSTDAVAPKPLPLGRMVSNGVHHAKHTEGVDPTVERVLLGTCGREPVRGRGGGGVASVGVVRHCAGTTVCPPGR